MKEAGTVIVSLLSSNIFSLRPIIFKENRNESTNHLLHSICQMTTREGPWKGPQTGGVSQLGWSQGRSTKQGWSESQSCSPLK